MTRPTRPQTGVWWGWTVYVIFMLTLFVGLAAKIVLLLKTGLLAVLAMHVVGIGCAIYYAGRSRYLMLAQCLAAVAVFFIVMVVMLNRNLDWITSL